MAMGVPYVPKHQYLADAAVPLIQFIPPAPIRPSYPPTPSDGNGVLGGGPFGSQVGVPSYFMPEDDEQLRLRQSELAARGQLPDADDD